jgi:hypothetical protein
MREQVLQLRSKHSSNAIADVMERSGLGGWAPAWDDGRAELTVGQPVRGMEALGELRRPLYPITFGSQRRERSSPLADETGMVIWRCRRVDEVLIAFAVKDSPQEVFDVAERIGMRKDERAQRPRAGDVRIAILKALLGELSGPSDAGQEQQPRAGARRSITPGR